MGVNKKKYTRAGKPKIINLPEGIIELITVKALNKKPRSNFKNYVEDLIIKHAGK